MKEVSETEIKKIANFVPYVTDVSEMKDYLGNQTDCIVEIECRTNMLSFKRSYSFGEIEKIDFNAIDPRLWVADDKKSIRTLKNFIRKQIAELDIQSEVVLDRLGWYRSGNEILFCAGSTIIPDDAGAAYRIDRGLGKYKLCIDNECSEQEALIGALNVINIDFTISAPIFITGMLGVMRKLVLDAGVNPPCALYVVGETQTRKTTLTKVATMLYNRDSLSSNTCGIARLDSSVPKIMEHIEKQKDSSFILDDLFKSSDRTLRRKMEGTLREVLRACVDNTRRQNMNASPEINAQLIVTAEYLLDNLTDIGRCFIIHVDSPVDSERLHNASKHPLVLSTFYHYFIKYISSNYGDIVEQIRMSMDLCRANSYAHSGRFERIYEMQSLLECLFDILCEYAVEKNIMTTEQKAESCNMFHKTMEHHLEFHKKYVERLLHNDTTFNLSVAVLQLAKDRQIVLEKNYSDNNLVYIKPSVLAEAIQNNYPSQRGITVNKITKYFAERGISKIYSGCKNSKNVVKHNGEWYLALRQDRVLDDARGGGDTFKNIV